MKRKDRAQSSENETRQRLVEAGIRLFGLHGFAATSTRQLAAQAGTNLAAIPYHFGSKEGLYRAVLERVVAVKQAECGEMFGRVLAVCGDASSGREQVLAAMRAMVRGMAAVMLATEEARHFSSIMMQEQIAPTDSFDILFEGFFRRVHAVWAALLGRLTGLPPGSMELDLRALSVMGQLVIFRVAMSAALRYVGSDRLSEAHLRCIADLVVNQTEAIVAGFSPVSTVPCQEGAQP